MLQILQNHIVPGAPLNSAVLASRERELTTLAGETIKVSFTRADNLFGHPCWHCACVGALITFRRSEEAHTCFLQHREVQRCCKSNQPALEPLILSTQVTVNDDTGAVEVDPKGNNEATVVTPDLAACNAVVHVIDLVLVPGDLVS